MAADIVATDDESQSAQLFGKELVRKMVVPVTFAVLAYAALLLYGDSRAVLSTLNGLPALAFATGIMISLASLFVRGLRWQLYLRATQIRIPAADSALVFSAGLGMSITPGKVGEILKSLLLKERFDVPVARSGPIVIAERLMDVAALFLLGGISAMWQRNQVAAVAIAVVFLVAFFCFGRSHRLALLALRVLSLVPIVRRYRAKLLTAHDALRALWGFGTFSLAFLLSILSWGLQALIISVFARALQGTPLSFAHALIAYSAPLLAGSLAFLPGGLGLTEASMAGTLRVLSGMPAPTAIAVTLLARAVTFWLAVLLGLMALATWRAVRRPPAVDPLH
jgi:uncharacterized protein (TIRG00374 family)